MKRTFFQSFLIAILTIATNTGYASGDVPASVIYAPVINITTEDSNLSYPSALKVNLLLNNKGSVEKVFYSDSTSQYVKDKVDGIIKTAKFTPYIKDGQPVRSLVPFTLNFYIMDYQNYVGGDE